MVSKTSNSIPEEVNLQQALEWIKHQSNLNIEKKINDRKLVDIREPIENENKNNKSIKTTAEPIVEQSLEESNLAKACRKKPVLPGRTSRTEYPLAPPLIKQDTSRDKNHSKVKLHPLDDAFLKELELEEEIECGRLAKGLPKKPLERKTIPMDRIVKEKNDFTRKPNLKTAMASKLMSPIVKEHRSLDTINKNYDEAYHNDLKQGRPPVTKKVSLDLPSEQNADGNSEQDDDDSCSQHIDSDHETESEDEDGIISSSTKQQIIHEYDKSKQLCQEQLERKMKEMNLNLHRKIVTNKDEIEARNSDADYDDT